ncbi:MAG: Gfo/Idh/MocA family oxidoreductase [Verrucomicrobia bacterium]|nr:Gfo/Idh/MocA family oxidoreductase [Verrucomicrobiota bacterium]MCG2678364.1 Gfo/Idh/MocA family oxidoreductase [Kiritimatiellia bacterium]MBU4247345.1 Gfo/Idh/MocA family oxidoreductase [Verrucomicrobiota bacterium]MBU4291470.1 Gfo/Idh/MocA family oxidoreductase [Verrucomicrobiota bacterium]MBU4428734.1 Gfo/Idh/MocA family oxidoreductase [Verrucomicrobiota bacterium]
MKIIRVGIIGQGRSGRDIHGAYLTTDPKRFKIVAAVDLLEERRKWAAAAYHCDVYADYRDLFPRRDIDLIVNATPSCRHAPVTIAALNAGFHTLCEKPMAATVKDVDRMIAASKKARRILAIYQQARYAPYFQQVRKVINSGVLGRIVQISVAFNGFSRRWDWQTLQAWNGGSLLNTGPHPLDQALQLFGDGRPEVRCFMDRANTFGDAEDHVKLILSGKGHPLIDLEVSSCCLFPDFTYNVYGTRGGMKGTQASMEWQYFKPGEAPRQKLIVTPLNSASGSPSYCSETLKWHKGQWPEQAPASADGKRYTASKPSLSMSVVFYTMLYKTLTRGAPLEITPQQIRRQIAVIEECHRQNPQIYGKKKRP